MKRRLLPTLLAALLLLPLLTVPARAEDDSCGDGVTWALSGGTLTISKTDSGASGAMADYGMSAPDLFPPWDGDKGGITKVVIEAGVTSIGEHAFYDCGNLVDVTIPGGVTSIGKGAFESCAKLTGADIPSSVKIIGVLAFDRCEKLTSVGISSGVEVIGECAFQLCERLEAVTIPASVREIQGGAFINSGLKTVYYGGSQAEWEAIVRDPNNTNIKLKNIRIEYNSTGPIDPDPPDPPPVTYTVTFDAQGGTAVPSATVTSGGRAARPADPVRSGYAFGGWFKESGCTTAWNFDSDAVTGDVTLYAKWTPRSSGGGGGGGGGGGWHSPPAAYPITVPARPLRGRLSVSRSSAERGVTVRVTAVPEEGCRLETLRAVSGGKAVPLTEEGGGRYAFAMLAGPVEVEAVFVEEETVSPFADVAEGAWYYDAVRFVSENGLMGGYGNGQFGVNDRLSRAQLAQILYNREGRPSAGGGPGFADTDPGAWYSDAVAWAAERELPFTDAEEAGEHALEALRWAVEKGIVGGYGDGRLAPRGLATRAQAAKMLWSFLER